MTLAQSECQRCRELEAELALLRPPRIIVVGELILDTGPGAVTYQGNAVELQHRPFTVLATLAANPGRVFSVIELLRAVWGSEDYHHNNVAEQVRRIRMTLHGDGNDQSVVATIRGVGYFVQKADDSAGIRNPS